MRLFVTLNFVGPSPILSPLGPIKYRFFFLIPCSVYKYSSLRSINTLFCLPITSFPYTTQEEEEFGVIANHITKHFSSCCYLSTFLLSILLQCLNELYLSLYHPSSLPIYSFRVIIIFSREFL
jgi:hypothetical protein